MIAYILSPNDCEIYSIKQVLKGYFMQFCIVTLIEQHCVFQMDYAVQIQMMLETAETNNIIHSRSLCANSP